MDPIKFSREPYKITYMENGEKKTITRRPPPLLHDMLPTDIVELTTTKNDDWEAGDRFAVKHINPRHPNVLQIQNGDGDATFVDYYDLNLKEAVAPRDGVDPRENPGNNRYLLWP